MKIIIVYLGKEGITAKELTKDDFISFNQDNDYKVFHVVIIHSRFRKIGEHNLKYNCALHLDWCMEEVVKNYGKELFLE